MSGREGHEAEEADREPTPAERRLLELLVALREDPPYSESATMSKIVARAQWQRDVRDVLAVFGRLAGAVAGAAALLIGREARRRDERP